MSCRRPLPSAAVLVAALAMVLFACSESSSPSGAGFIGSDGDGGVTMATPDEHEPVPGPDAKLPVLAANGYPVVPTGAAVAVLDTLTVDDGGIPAPYDRHRFGPGWADPDGDGCTGRQAAIVTAARPGSLVVGARCRVEAVTIVSLNDGTVVSASTAGEVGRLIQVDHVVPVRDAYRQLCCSSGLVASRVRALFYNDPDNLVAVSARSNTTKSDFLFGDARFGYPEPAVACQVAERTVRVKAAYGLTVQTAEADALRVQLQQCPISAPSG